MKKVLLLGDSIRLNYMPKVYRDLSDRAEIYGPEDNCRFTAYTLWHIPTWLNEFGTPDVIHWNNGIWDAARFNQTDIFTPLPQYIDNLGRIYKELKKTGAKIIFATSTLAKDLPPVHSCETICLYNKAAVAFLTSLDSDIEINDLHEITVSNPDLYICEDNLHLSKEGIKAVGNRVIEVLGKYI